MTRDESNTHDAAQKAVDYCVKIQAPEGGWRYQPGSRQRFVGHGLVCDGDAKCADGRPRGAQPGVRPDQQISGLGRPRRRRSLRLSIQAGATKPLTAEGLLSRQYLGWAHDDLRLRNGVEYLLANLPDWNNRNVYYWYYGTQVCHHMEGKDWRKWNEVMRQISAGAPGEAGRGTRQLGPERRPLGRRGRPALRDLLVALHARSLLPAFADLSDQGDGTIGRIALIGCGQR